MWRILNRIKLGWFNFRLGRELKRLQPSINRDLIEEMIEP